MPLLILHNTLLGVLVTGTAQTGKWRHSGPWRRGAGRLSPPAAPAGTRARVAAPSSFWQAASEFWGRPRASSAKARGLVPRGKVGRDPEGQGASLETRGGPSPPYGELEALPGPGLPDKVRMRRTPATYW